MPRTGSWVLPHVTVDGDQVVVDMLWGFRARFPRAAIARVARDRRRPFSRGAHGWRGRWLVNSRGTNLVTMDLEPEQRARVLGVPVRLRQLTVSVDDPDELVEVLSR